MKTRREEEARVSLGLGSGDLDMSCGEDDAWRVMTGRRGPRGITARRRGSLLASEHRPVSEVR